VGSEAAVILRRFDRPYDGDWSLATGLVLEGIASPHTRRAYSQALEEFLIWFRDSPNRQFNKATVQKYCAELAQKGLAPSSINVRLSAIRRLALDAAENNLLDLAMAVGTASVIAILGQYLWDHDRKTRDHDNVAGWRRLGSPDVAGPDR
jgi:hypothetical protein